MEKSTSRLLNGLTNSNDIIAFLNENEKELLCETLPQCLSRLLAEKDLTVAAVAEESGRGDYAYKIFNGNKNPTRDVLISIALGMGLTLPETQLVLRLAKFAYLDPRNKRDSIFIFAINKRLNIYETNAILIDTNEKEI
ncbi:MAG: helix-turn-helix transcriptional regulator [Clostridia bacterium]|nr:helix-turn-helix transcriptional regulator [Clostridia bacterium]